MKRLIIVLGVTGLIACHSPLPTAPLPIAPREDPALPPLNLPENPPLTVQGRWAGTMTNGSQSYAAMLKVVQDGEKLSGEWSGTGLDGGDEGVMFGTYKSDGIITMRWQPSLYYNCSMFVRGTVSGTVITASYSSIDCSSNVPIGSVTLTRE